MTNSAGIIRVRLAVPVLVSRPAHIEWDTNPSILSDTLRADYNTMMISMSSEQMSSIMLFPTIYVRQSSKSEQTARRLHHHLDMATYYLNRCDQQSIDAYMLNLTQCVLYVYKFADRAEKEYIERADRALYARMKQLCVTRNDYIGYHVLEYLV